mgnify:CR=1 FL=1
MDNARKVEIAELAGIMITESGRNVISRHLTQCGAFDCTFEIDPYKHAFRAGERSSGLRLINELKDAVPLEYNLLLKERNEQ